jgi:hypothetical protein
MSGLEKALFNLKVSQRLSYPGDGGETRCLHKFDGLHEKEFNTDGLDLVHSEATEPTSRKSQQRREDRERQAQEGALPPGRSNPPYQSSNSRHKPPARGL